jgi:hypothetical protein
LAAVEMAWLLSGTTIRHSSFVKTTSTSYKPPAIAHDQGGWRRAAPASPQRPETWEVYGFL